jgi:hypothetical protein
MRGSRPLRFLAIVLGGWTALRAALLAPPWWAPPAGAASAQSPRPIAVRQDREIGPAAPERPGAGIGKTYVEAVRPAAGATRQASALSPPVPSPQPSPGLPPSRVASAAFLPSPAPNVGPPPGSGPGSPSLRRWALSAWSFVRRGGAAPLAAGGLLGGSQAGARLTYRLNRDPERPLAVALRLSSPLPGPAGAEAALGLDWQPAERLPLHLLAERRQALGRDGRSAFGITILGGIADARLGRFRLDAYAQAGLVGTRSRDAFGDGSIRLSLPMNEKLRLGAGAWAAAQPGLSRLDLGPQASLRLPVAGRAVTVAADWRRRVAGNSAPGSGPTLTLATEF